MIESTESSFIKGTRAWIRSEIADRTSADVQQGVTFTFVQSPYMEISRQKALLIKYIIPELRKIGFRSRVVSVPHESYLDFTVKQTRPDLTEAFTNNADDDDTDTSDDDSDDSSSDEDSSDDEESDAEQTECKGCHMCGDV